MLTEPDAADALPATHNPAVRRRAPHRHEVVATFTRKWFNVNNVKFALACDYSHFLEVGKARGAHGCALLEPLLHSCCACAAAVHCWQQAEMPPARQPQLFAEMPCCRALLRIRTPCLPPPPSKNTAAARATPIKADLQGALAGSHDE